jgi:hypothetical protein
MHAKRGPKTNGLARGVATPQLGQEGYDEVAELRATTH